MERERDNGYLTPSWNVSGVRLAFAKFLESAPSLTTTHVSPRNFLSELKKMREDQSYRMCLMNGEYGQCHIKNGAPCLFVGDLPPEDTGEEGTSEVKDASRDDKNSVWSVFKQAVKIEAHSLIVFKGVWFASRVEVTGSGPVFFNECLFGAATHRSHRDAPSPAFASVHASVGGLCAFSECEFIHNCGSVGEAGGCEVPVLIGTGQTKLNVHNSSFFGSGIVSTAIMLSENALLEAENVSITRCGSHSLVVSDTSSALVFRSVFSQSNGGIWVKNNGQLEIRDSSLETVSGGRSNLVLTDKGCCTSHKCTISATAASGPSCGQSLVIARDRSHLSLDACELFWVQEDATPEDRCKLPLRVPTPGHDRDQLDELGLFLIMLMEHSEGTFKRCLLRLPQIKEAGGWCAAVGVLLRGVRRVDAFPIYAVENSVVYDCNLDKEESVEAKGVSAADVQRMWGLVLPHTSDRSYTIDLQRLRSMWIETNHFFYSNGERAKDMAKAVTTYEVYCKATGRSSPNFQAGMYDTLPSFSTNSFTKEDDPTLVNNPLPENVVATTSPISRDASEPVEDGGCRPSRLGEYVRTSACKNVTDDDSSGSTSLTSYGEEDSRGSRNTFRCPKPRRHTLQGGSKKTDATSEASSISGAGKKSECTAQPTPTQPLNILKEGLGQEDIAPTTANGAVSMPPLVARASEEFSFKRAGVGGFNGRPPAARPNGTQRCTRVINQQQIKKEASSRRAGKIPNISGRVPSSSITRNRYIRTKKNSKVPEEDKEISLNSDGLLGTFLNHSPTRTPRRAFSSAGIAELSSTDRPAVNGSSSDMRPWDVVTSREMISRGALPHGQGSCRRTCRGRIECVWDDEDFLNHTSGLSHASTDRESSLSRNRRQNGTGFYTERMSRNTLSARSSLGFHVRRAQWCYADDATVRLYDEFLRKLNTAQHFSELLGELRNDQRRRERLTRAEMERQAERLHSTGLQTRCGRHNQQACGSLRNCVPQKRADQKIRSSEGTPTETTTRLLTLEAPSSQVSAGSDRKEVPKPNTVVGEGSKCGSIKQCAMLVTSHQTPEVKALAKEKRRGQTKSKRRSHKR